MHVYPWLLSSNGIVVCCLDILRSERSSEDDSATSPKGLRSSMERPFRGCQEIRIVQVVLFYSQDHTLQLIINFVIIFTDTTSTITTTTSISTAATTTTTSTVTITTVTTTATATTNIFNSNKYTIECYTGIIQCRYVTTTTVNI